MSTHLKAIALFAILVTSIGITPAFGQGPPIEVTTDKESYGSGEDIVISGTVSQTASGVPVTIQVIAANGNIVTLAQVDVDPTRTFSHEITSGGPLWKSSGTYTVKAVYGGESRTDQTTFQFGAGAVAPSGPTIRVDTTDFMLSYSITGGSLLSVTPDLDANSLLITISTTSDGELTITLPRALIDARTQGDTGDDDDFFVLVDGEEVEFDEVATSSDRTLTIPFPDGAEQIEIIGTHVVPEFGAIAALILAIAIVSIIAVTARSRLSVLPKY